MNLSKTNSVLLGIGFLVAVLLVYSPVYFHSYLFTDDYAFLEKVAFADGSWQRFAGIMKLFQPIGRPLTGAFIALAYSAADSIDNIRYVRVLTLLGYALFAWLFCRELLVRRWSAVTAFCASLLVVLLPSYQLYAYWAQYFVVPYALSLAFLAGKSVWAVRQEQGLRALSGKLLTAILLETLSILFYQPAAMIFWLYPALALLNDDKVSDGVVAKRMTAGLAVVGGACVIDVLSIKLPLMFGGAGKAEARTALTLDIGKKVSWFYRDVLTDIFNLWKIVPSAGIKMVLLGLFLLVIFAVWRRTGQLSFIGFTLLMAMVPLSYLPNLLVAECWSSYRTQVALATTVLAIFISAVMRLVRSSALVNNSSCRTGSSLTIVLLTLVLCFGAYRNVRDNEVLPQARELAAIRTRMAMIGSERPEKINVCLASFNDHLGKVLRYDEIGIPSLYKPWVPVPMVKLLLREMGWNSAVMPKIAVQKSCQLPETTEPNEVWLDSVTILREVKGSIGG